MFESGTVYGLVGPNGAGKSSIMSVLAGLVPASSGSVRWKDGKRGLIGAVLAESGLHHGRTVRETLRLRGRYLRVGDSEVEVALRLAGLDSVARRRVGALSLGMRMRLGIAAAMLGDPELVLLDEPMNGLDPNGIAWVRDIVNDLRARGVVVVISSHLLGELEQMIDVAVIVSAGKITRVERMKAAHSEGSMIETTRPGAFLEALQARGLPGEIRGTMVVSGLSAPESVRLAVERSLDVLTVRGASIDLEALYAQSSSGEHIAEVSR